jgi:hypothetical protein
VGSRRSPVHKVSIAAVAAALTVALVSGWLAASGATAIAQMLAQ